MAGSPKVSVIIPVYNAEKYLRQCLDSIIEQTLKEVEIICVDDGSTDGSVHILKEYSVGDPRIKVFLQKNQGAGPARNAAMEAASGEFIAFMDADDYYAGPNALEALYRAAKEHNALISGGSLLYLDRGKVSLAAWDQESYFFDRAGWMNYKELQQDYHYQRFLFNRAFLCEHSITFPDYRRYQDPPFFVKAMVLAERFYAVEENIYVYRKGSTSARWNAQKVCDMLNGTIDVLELSGQNDLGHLHYLTAMRVLNSEFLHGIIRNSISGEPVDISEIFKRFHKALNFDLLAKERKPLDIKYLIAMENIDYSETPAKTDSKDVMISLVVAAYNVEKYLLQCLDSLVKQTYQNIEIICVNDGSADGSLAVLKRYAEQDQRICVIAKKENEGLLAARKSGVAQAHGQYVMFVDSDDYLELDACRKIVALAKEYPVDILQFTIGVKDYSNDEASKQWLEKALTPTGTHLSGEAILENFYVKRENTTSLLGKLYSTALCKAVYRNIPDFYCYVGEDIFQQFYFAFLGDTYRGVKTAPLYWYQRGLGVSNSQRVNLPKFELYCRMANLTEYVREFLQKNGCERQYETYYEAMSVRMMEDCCRIYENRLGENDKKPGGRLLCKYWYDHPVADSVMQRCMGISMKQFAAKHIEIPVYTKLCRTDKDSLCPPKVSIIIPVYNVQSYLRDCLDSVIHQTIRDIEIICVNDGSIDESLSILEEYFEIDDRITIISKENSGPSASRNVGLQYANGEYVLFLDSDDQLKETAAEKLYHYAADKNLDILFFDADASYESVELKNKFMNYETYYHRRNAILEVLTGPQLLSELERNGEYRVSPCLQMIKRKHIQENQIAFYDGILHEDNLFTFENLLQAERTAVINEAYYVRRVRENSIMTKQRGYANLYGFLMCYANMLAFSMQHSFDNAAQQSMRTVIEEMRQSVCSTYGRLSQEEKNRLSELTPIETLWFQAASGASKIIQTPSKEQTAEATKVLDEAALIRASWTYRIGRFITFIPRKVRGGVRCFSEHGWRYTWWRVLVHLGLKEDPYK